MSIFRTEPTEYTYSELEEKLNDEAQLVAILTSALEAIAYATDNEDPRDIALDTLSAIEAQRICKPLVTIKGNKNIIRGKKWLVKK